MKTLLMVDDDPTIRRIAEICLTRIGNWQVTSVDSGYEALQILQTFIPDTIVLDVMMRGMDGSVLLKRIRANEALADVPVIFLTALVQPQEIDSYLEMGVAGVIIKPFDPLKLSAEVTRISEQERTNRVVERTQRRISQYMVRRVRARRGTIHTGIVDE